MDPRIKKATLPSTTEERENEQLEQEKCFKNSIIRLTHRMSTITAVDVAAAVLEETKHWPTRITCRHNRAKKLCTFEVLVEPELAKEMALCPLFIKRQKMMVDDCSMDPSHEFEVRGCSASYTNEEILRLIQQRVGPNATVSGFSSILVRVDEDHSFEQGAFQMRISGLEERAVELYLGNVKVTLYWRDTCFKCLGTGHSWKRCKTKNKRVLSPQDASTSSKKLAKTDPKVAKVPKEEVTKPEADKTEIAKDALPTKTAEEGAQEVIQEAANDSVGSTTDEAKVAAHVETNQTAMALVNVKIKEVALSTAGE
jgi:hypothetical protein